MYGKTCFNIQYSYNIEYYFPNRNSDNILFCLTNFANKRLQNRLIIHVSTIANQVFIWPLRIDTHGKMNKKWAIYISSVFLPITLLQKSDWILMALNMENVLIIPKQGTANL